MGGALGSDVSLAFEFGNFTVPSPFLEFISLPKHSACNLNIKLPACLISRYCHKSAHSESRITNTDLYTLVSIYTSTAKMRANAAKGWRCVHSVRRFSMKRAENDYKDN